MSNSPLVNYTKISPNRTSPRKKPITKITIHHVAGNLTVETIGNVFAPASRKASSNYGVDNKGRIGMYVEEKNRAWTSSNSDNDNQAVTIEVANDGGAPDWHVSDVALAKTIDLCVDICQRNGIKKLNFTGDKSGNLTMHKWFAATACPGPYLESKFPYIASEVNKRLGTAVAPSPVASAGTKFSPRKTAPSATDKYWVHSSFGGLNECILISGKSTLSNCVGYAWGRFYELIGSRPKLSRRNAEDWYGYTADGYERGQTPRLGAVICWRKGQAGNQNDGAGHVAIVEEIKPNGDIVTSNSNYKGVRFYTRSLTKASGYRLGSAYTFQGFIYPPIEFTSEDQESVITPYRVKVTASVLNIRKQPTTSSVVTGAIKDRGVYTIIEEAAGTGAKLWGKLKSGAGWISLDFTQKR